MVMLIFFLNLKKNKAMAETDLKRGDIVKLKSGSCGMTISEIKTETKTAITSHTAILPDNHITVEWFWKGEIKRETFYESQLKQEKPQ